MLFRSMISGSLFAAGRFTPMVLLCCVMPVLLIGCDHRSDFDRKLERIERYTELDEVTDTWRFDYAMALGHLYNEDLLQWTFMAGSPRSFDYALLISVGRHEPREVVRQTILEVAEEFPEQWLDRYLLFAMSFDPSLFSEIAAMHPSFELCDITSVGMPLLVLAAGEDGSPEMLDLLLERGCDPNILSHGLSPLMYALSGIFDEEIEFDLDAARKLVRHGADLDLAGVGGTTARTLLQEEGMHEEIAILEREAASARRGADR